MLCGTSCAIVFAAVRADGSIVTWGDANFGRDSSAAQDQLSNVRQVQATAEAFAASRDDGSVITWGGDASENSYGLCSRSKLVGVHLLQVGPMARSSQDEKK